MSRRQSPEAAATLVGELNALDIGTHTALEFDAQDPQSVARLIDLAFDRYGRVDVLVNNVGPWGGESIRDVSLTEWRTVLEGNLTAAWMASRSALKYMDRSGWGRVINISAGSAYVRNHSTYGLAKAALITLTEELAAAVSEGITVNCVAPGQIAESVPELGELGPEIVDRIIEATPTKRLVTRQEVADVVAVLCSDGFASLNGVTLPLDGGWRLNRF